MSKTLSKAERTRQFIIETTAPIFNTKGYEGTSMSDITEATGLTKGSIYGNFENKEEVALAAFDHNHGYIKKIIVDKVNQAKTYHDKLMVYATVYHSFTRKSGFVKGGCPVLNTAIEADDTNGPLRDKAAGAILNWKNSIINLVKAGIAAGEFRHDIDQEQTALSIIALIEGGVMISKITNNPTSLDTILKTVTALIDGLKVQL
ncbi:TetR/AcrR family transcriptional regulator [Mucilaginibacter mali]|uniref:TetR/AcrR family transcriptional regulator n=1 Tax=Mucilaginibacter mali TaxID=2740462 RepID=A0A7D4TM30_9SPHI|nr:TetR/AcrR family transcriptional regulator [Mucilaginibacter mali]QKJ29693.1 TetR/AcrR family transcriptional regulator [Mucilaginibacter mali]